MQTEFTYNGVLVRDVLTNSVSHVPVKDSTGVDQIGVRVTYDCTGIVHASQETLTRGVAVQVLGEELPSLLMRLSKDRRAFQLRIGQMEFYDVRPGAAEPNAPRGTVTADLHK